MRNLSLAGIVLLILALGPAARAEYPCGGPERFETVTLADHWIYVYRDETKSVSLYGGWRYVKKLFIQARGYTSESAKFDVIANGEVKGTIYVPGNDPTYTVTIDETVQSIELRGTHGGTAEIMDIKAVEAVRPANEFSCTSESSVSFRSQLPSSNIATWLAQRAIRNVERLRPYADPETEYVQYLLPVKTVAGRAHAVAAAEGDLSAHTRSAMRALSQQIIFAEPVISGLMKRDVTFDLSVELLSISHEIEDRLH